ncbi:MAG: hypothetical protein HZA62_11205 [Rhodocyclales bacterium]|nr:hypothetical protein [Rhodocyclales bacterium]
MKSPIRSALRLCLLLLSSALEAQEAPVPRITADNAPAAKARAKEIRTAAQQRFESDKADCNTRMLAIGCLSAAQDRRAESVRQAEAIQREANRAERDAREAKLAEKEARRAAREKDDEGGRPVAEANYREQGAKRAAEREARQAAEQARLDSQRSRVAAEREAKQRKIEERRLEDARRAAAAPENARKAAERKRKHAEKVHKIEQRQRDYAEKLKYREAEKAAEEARRAKAAAK